MNAQLEITSVEIASIDNSVDAPVVLPLDVLALVGGGEGTVTPY